MDIMERDRFKDKLIGQPFVVKKIMGGIIILEAENTPNKFSLSRAIVELFFDRAENKNSIN